MLAERYVIAIALFEKHQIRSAVKTECKRVLFVKIRKLKKSVKNQI